jgi:choline-sulfatase
VPQRSSLIFDYGGDPGMRFEVRAAMEGSPVKTLFSATSKKKQWTEAKVDLSRLGGKLVRLDLATEGKGRIAGWGEPDLVRSGAEPTLPAISAANRPKNLIYILIDTSRQDVYRPFNPDTRVQAPVMEALARESTLFANAYANSNWTNPSVATVLTGVYPFTHQVKQQDSVVPERLAFVSEHLQKHGFTTAAFIANGYTSDKFGFKRGWDHYRNYIREEKPSEAEHVYADTIQWVSEHVARKNSGRFFLYIQTIDPHVPYDVQQKYRELYYEGSYTGKLGTFISGEEVHDMTTGKLKVSEDDKRWTHAVYDGEVTYHDEQMGVFLQKLRELKVLDETLLIITNDHGEEMFEHGHVGHGHSLYEELVRAPLLMRYPKLLDAGKVKRDVVELVDMVPTELELLGVPPMAKTEGVSLLGALFGKPAMSEGYAISEFQSHMRSVRLGRYKLIQRTSINGNTLYDVITDRGEKTDLTDSHPLARRACEVYLGEGLHLQQKSMRLSRMTRPAALSAGKAKIDPELRRQLQALGYLN